MKSTFPALNSNLRIIPTTSNGGPQGHIVKSPSSGKIFELGEKEYFLCKQLNGETAIPDIQGRFEDSFGTGLPLENLEDFIHQLSTEGFLAAPIDDRPVEESSQGYRTPERKKWKLGNPDPFLSRLASGFAWCFNKTFLGMTLVIALFAVATLLTGWKDFFTEISRLAHPLVFSGVFVLWVLLVNFPNELAKAVACKYYGGNVREFGVRLAFNIIPQFYFDFDESHLFREKKKRLWTLSAGIFVLFLLWSFVTISWKVTEGWISVHEFLLYLMVAYSVGILLNINPFSRRFGYFYISSSFSQPNLRKRAVDAAIAWLTFRRSPEPLTPREKLGFRLYGLLVIFYVVVISSLFLYFAGGWLTEHYKGVGALIFIGLLFLMLQGPIKKSMMSFKIVRSLKEMTSGKLRRRLIKIGVLCVLIILFFIPYSHDTGGTFQFLPAKHVEVRIAVPSEVEKILVEEGQWVTKGQVLAVQAVRDQQKDLETTKARLDEKLAQLRLLKNGPKPEEILKAKEQVKTAQVKLSFSTDEVNQLKSLFQEGVISKEVYDDSVETRDLDKQKLEEAKAQLTLVQSGFRPEEIDALEAEVRRLETEVQHFEEDLKLTQIISPDDGQVVTPHLSDKVGQYLTKGDLLLIVEDSRKIQAEVEVPEADISDVTVNAEVKIKTWAYTDVIFTGKVIQIAPNAVEKPTGNVVRVLTEIPNPDMLLKPEMTGYAKIRAGKEPAGIVFSSMLIRFFRVEFWSWWP